MSCNVAEIAKIEGSVALVEGGKDSYGLHSIINLRSTHLINFCFNSPATILIQAYY